MKRLHLLFLIFLCSSAQASEIFERDHDQNSVVLAPICVPSLSGQGWATVDFNTTSLNITIIASGDGAYQTFDYSGVNIDDGPADFTWGNPPASAIEIDAITTGAASGCISLSIRDEVLAVVSATEWSITFTDGEVALMDHEAFIRIKGATSVVVAALNNVSTAEVNTQVDLALADINLDHFAGTATALPNIPAGTYLDNMMGVFLNCEVNTLNFAGSITTLACILTDLSGAAVTQASNDLEGLQIVVTSGAEIREARFINDTTWDGANSELQLTISRALPATLADAVTVIIR